MVHGEPGGGGRHAMIAPQTDAFVRLVRSHGRNTVSHQVLDARWHHYLGAAGEAGIAFRDFGSFALAAGDPLCAPEHTAMAIEGFRAECRKAGRRIAFVSAGESCARAASALGLGTLKVGQEGLFDLDRYTFAGGAMKALRHHESRARRRGLSVRVAEPGEPDWPAVVPALDRLADAWLRRRPCGGMGFLLELRRPSDAAERDATIFCAVMDGQAVAYLRAVPIYGSAGVYLEDYVYGENAPDGTVEALFHEACDVLRERGAAYLTWGTSPLAGMDPRDLRDAPLVGRVLRTAFERVSWPYSFRSLHAFKSRFHPTRWAPKYLVFDRPFDIRLGLALARAYAPRPDVSALLARFLPGRSRPEPEQNEPVESHA